MPIDTIYTEFTDEAGLAADCAAARRSGFLAKMAFIGRNSRPSTALFFRQGRRNLPS